MMIFKYWRRKRPSTFAMVRCIHVHNILPIRICKMGYEIGNLWSACFKTRAFHLVDSLEKPTPCRYLNLAKLKLGKAQ